MKTCDQNCIICPHRSVCVDSSYDPYNMKGVE